MMTLSAQADLIRLYLDANEGKLVWSQMQSWTVPEGWEQFDWQEIIDKLPIEAFKEAGNCKIEGYPTTAIKDIRTQHDKKTLAVSGKIVALSDVEPDPESMPYRCTNCGVITESAKGKAPKRCSACDWEELEPEISMAKNLQVYRLQEGNLLLSGMAKEDNLLYACKPGHSAYTFGVLRFRAYTEQKTGLTRFRKYVELANIESRHTTDIQLTNTDIDRFNELVKDPLHYQILVESFAPHLYGLMEQKELCIMVLASQGIARPFNGLIAGPPATGKTQLIEYATKLSPNGHLANITNATVAGLTSGVDVDPDTQMKITRPGLFAIADGGIVGITELQAIKAQKTDLNDALERKEVVSNKVDGKVQLPARCAVLIDSNNYRGNWDYNLSLAENMKFMEPNLGAFLSRIDLISITERTTDKDTNRRIAYANFDSHASVEDPIQQHLEDWENEDGIPRYGFKTLQKYFAYVTSLPLPPLDKSLREKYADNFIDARENNPDYLVDGRYNRIIAMYARVLARLLLKPITDAEDMEIATQKINECKNVETKNGTATIALGLKDQNKLNMEDTFWEVVKLCTKKRMDYWQGQQQEIEYASETEILYELTQTHKWPDHKARKYLAKAKKDCLLLESYGQGKLVKA